MANLLIGFTGDVMIGRHVNTVLKTTSSRYPWGNLLPLFAETDLNIANLEAALTLHDQAVPKVFNFRSDPQNVRVLQDARIDVVNLANNHVLDYGVPGLEDTLDTLDNAGILHTGAGRTLDQAQRPVIIERAGLRMAILGYTDNEPGWNAGPNRPGTRYLQVGDLEPLAEDVAKIRQSVDLVIISYHWGPNMRVRPSGAFVDFAHQIIECGADIFHGHSAHVFQGVEAYKGGLILYDTGDFVDDYAIDPDLRNDLTFWFVVEANQHGVTGLQLVPAVISKCQVNHAEGEDLELLMGRMQALSAEFGTQLEQRPEGLGGRPTICLEPLN